MAITTCTKLSFLGIVFYFKNFGHQARHWMARKKETPKLKDQKNKQYGPKGQGQIKTYNSFDPLAKFDPICSLCNDNGHNEQNCPPSKEEKQKMRIPTRINVSYLYVLTVMKIIGLWIVGARDT